MQIHKDNNINVVKYNLGKVDLKSMHPAVFPTNMHAGWLQGFALFTICSCFAIRAVCFALFY